jgi:hypothetical protein
MAKVIIPEDGTRSDFTIYARDLRSLNWFLKTPLADSEVGEKVRKSKFIPLHPRRRGPSDKNPINIPQSQADYLSDPSLKSGNALPGVSFVFKTTPNSDIDATRQFTFTGRALDFIEYFDGKMKYETYVYFANGARHTLALGLAEEGQG